MHKPRPTGYPVKIDTSSAVLGCFAKCRDIPELYAYGDDISEALLNASEQLGEILARYARLGRPVPVPSPRAEGEWLVVPRGPA